tara:strand:- start:3290 stop:3547 length:258 start_codon:yes stop_codon:yes gene_type:complete
MANRLYQTLGLLSKVVDGMQALLVVVAKLQALGQAIDIEAVSMVVNGIGEKVAERLTGRAGLKLAIGVGLQLPQARFLEVEAVWA